MKNFYFINQTSPTTQNLKKSLLSAGWAENKADFAFGDQNLMSDELLQLFEYKNLLNAYCKQNSILYQPLTYNVDELNVHRVYKSIADSTNRWILKPATLNNGWGIVILNESAALLDFFKQDNRISGYHVLQNYIEPPALLQNKKFSLRMFVILTNLGVGFLYKNGYINVCQVQYNMYDTSRLTCHLTNEYLNHDGSTNNEQIMTQEWAGFCNYQSSITKACSEIFMPFITDNHILDEKLQIGILGVDFMIDNLDRIWLLEANHGPCFPTTKQHPLFEPLYQHLWRSIVTQVIQPNVLNGFHSTTSTDAFEIIGG